jgi:hypothetical protein
MYFELTCTFDPLEWTHLGRRNRKDIFSEGLVCVEGVTVD